MPDTISVKGSYLCGAVEIEAKTLATSVGASNCSMCRKCGMEANLCSR